MVEKKMIEWRMPLPTVMFVRFFFGYNRQRTDGGCRGSNALRVQDG